MLEVKLSRWAGIAGVASGASLAIADGVYFAALHNQPTSQAATSNNWVPWALLSLLAGYLALLFVSGLYSRQITEAKGLGLVAFLVALLGTSMYIGWSWSGAFLVPPVAQVAPDFLDMAARSRPGLVAAGFLSTFLLFGLGWVLVGIATVRAKVLPQVPAWLLILGAIINLAGTVARAPFGTVVLDAGLAWLGWSLWSEKRTAP